MTSRIDLPIQFTAPSTRKTTQSQLAIQLERKASQSQSEVQLERRLIVRQNGTTYTTVSDESLGSLLGKLIGKHAKQIGLSGNERYIAYASLSSGGQEVNEIAITALDAIGFDLDAFSSHDLVGDVLITGTYDHPLTEEGLNALSWLFEYVRVHRELASCEMQARCPVGSFSILWE
jgi:hypothetical protein